MNLAKAAIGLLAGMLLYNGLARADEAPAAMAPGTAPRVLASNLAFPEGPVLSPDGKTLYCVNVHAAFVSRIELRTGRVTREWVTLPGTGKGNGAKIGPDGALYVADVGRKLIARITLRDGLVTTVADKTAAGGEFNGPNDITFDKRGGLYFTDPKSFSATATDGAVYYVAPRTHAVSKFADGLGYPNGLVLSPDGRTLYVGESPLDQIDAFDVAANGTPVPGSKRIFAHVGGNAGGPDGLRLGPDGSVYVALFGDGVVAKLSSKGEILQRWPVGGKNPTAFCFSRDGKSIFVTETETNAVVQVSLGASAGAGQ